MSTMTLRKRQAVSVATLENLVRHETTTHCNVQVDRPLAKALLKYNLRNRTLSPGRVAYFVKILVEDRWINTGEPIILSPIALNEGQHRLHAIAESGVTAPLDIRFGIPDAAFYVTGSGATRSPGDVLSIIGVPAAAAMAAMLKLLMAYDAGISTKSQLRWRVGADEIVKSWERWPDSLAAHRTMANIFKHGSIYSASAAALTFLALRSKNEGQVKQFLTFVAKGEGRDANCPAMQLHARLHNDHDLRTGRNSATLKKFALFIEAWNCWIRPKAPAVLAWDHGMRFPSVSGVKL